MGARVIPAVDSECLLNPTKCVVDKAAEAASSVALGGLGEAAQSFLNSFWKFYIDWVITPWTKAASPVLAETCAQRKADLVYASAQCNPGALSGPVWEMRSHLMWLTTFVMTLMVLIAAAKMIWHRDGRPAADLLRAVVTTVLVSVAGVMLIDVLLTFGDEYSAWIIDAATGKDWISQTGKIPVDVTAANAGVMFVLGFVGVLFTLVQVVLLIMRSGVIVLFAAVLPLAAAGSASTWGRNWFEKITGWTFAFILYKPVAATIYATSIWLMQQSGDATSLVAGVSMMFVAILALPALIKLLVPAAGALGGSGGGGAGMTAAGMALAGGARRGGSAASSAGAAAGPKGAAVAAAAGAVKSTATGGSPVTQGGAS